VAIDGRGLLAGLLAALAMAGAALAQPALESEPVKRRPAQRLMVLEVLLNQASAGQWTLLERDGLLFAPADAFDEWRLKRPAHIAAVSYRGQAWFPLAAVPGFQSRFDFANQALELSFSPSAFAATRLARDPAARAALSPKLNAAFLNYDLSYTAVSLRGAAGTSDLGALGELGVSAGPGVFTTSFVGQNLTGEDARARRWTRLETTYTRDFLDTNTTLRLGDSSTRAGMWARAVYFGGIQIGRNFALQPGFITQPIPAITGTSVAPSTVELYINDALRQTSAVPPGPFAIDNFPLITGAGEARVVVRDLLGRETVLVQPFFTHSELLDEGLTDWSGEAGAVRRDIGLGSWRYGSAFVSGLARHGLNKELTLEARAEASARTRGAGAGASYALPLQALGQAALAVSDTDRLGAGTKTLLGLEYARFRHGLIARMENATRQYRQLGMTGGELPFRTQRSASYRYAFEGWGAIGLAAARIGTYDRGALSTYSANYSIPLPGRGALTLIATRVSGTTRASSVGFTFIVPLEGRLVATSSASHRGGRTEGYAGFSRALGAETGTGWRALAGRRAAERFVEGGAYYQGMRGLVSADVNASDAQQTVRLGAQGGLIGAGGRLFATRRVYESFALVEVPGYAGVGVGFQGTMLARTDAEGIALLPRLLPYQQNSIRLDPSELPINAELDSIEAVAVPAARSGVRVTFPVRPGRGALIRIVLEDGEPAPAGAELELEGDAKEFFVARRGESFVTGLEPKNRLRLKWKEASCAFDVELPPGALDEIARVGPVLCKGVER
jgi:outer membrane usher protein